MTDTNTPASVVEALTLVVSYIRHAKQCARPAGAGMQALNNAEALLGKMIAALSKQTDTEGRGGRCCGTHRGD